MFEDYPVKFLLDSEIEGVADETRRRLFRSDLPARKMLDGLRRFGGLSIVAQPDEQLGSYEAYVSFNPKRIFCKQSIYENAARGDAEPCGVIAHELGHYVLHPAKELRFLAANGNGIASFIHPNESAERQAWIYADAFQMPSWSVLQAETSVDLANLCNVSLDRAEKRWEQVRARPVIQFMQNDRVQAAWDLAAQIRGKDPQIVRQAGIYQIERTEANKMTHCGWLVQDGKPVAWMTLDHNWF